MYFLLEPPKKQSCLYLDFSPVRHTADLRPLELQDNKFVLFGDTKFVVICYSMNWKLTFKIFKI